MDFVRLEFFSGPELLRRDGAPVRGRTSPCYPFEKEISPAARGRPRAAFFAFEDRFFENLDEEGSISVPIIVTENRRFEKRGNIEEFGASGKAARGKKPATRRFYGDIHWKINKSKKLIAWVPKDEKRGRKTERTA